MDEEISELDLQPSKLQLYDVWNYSSLPKDQVNYPGALPRGKDAACTTFALRIFEVELLKSLVVVQGFEPCPMPLH
jgi:hypothetical protein